jgi:hypothetical protein
MGLKGDGPRTSVRTKTLKAEAEVFDNGVQDGWVLDDGATVAYHGKKKPMAVKAGKRPLIPVGRGAFSPALTDRQRRRGKVRTARAWGRMNDMLEKTNMTMEEFVAGLTPEELVRGRLKDKHGGFSGRPPAWVPHEFHRACMRELMKRGKDLWQVNYLAAIEAMTQVASGKVKGATVSDRLKAATFVIERLEGKTPDVLVVHDDAPWKMVIDDIVAQVPDEQVEAARQARNGLIGRELADVVDAEIVDDSEATTAPRQTAPTRRRAAARRVGR